MKIPRLALAILASLLLFTATITAQKEKPVPACTQKAFAAAKPFPKLAYDCPEGNDFDDKILKLPQRLSSLRRVMNRLEQFTNPVWWEVDVDELNACSVHKKIGQLTDEEKNSWRQGDYATNLSGNHEMRLILLDDPCYQTEWSGSNGFLLYRKDGRVYVSQVLNGYYSRIDNSVGIDYAKLNGRQMIEISTANSMPPSMLYYYFSIDPVTNKAVPAKIFKEGKKLTNQIYSDMLFADPKDVGLPANATELKVFVKGRLAPSFSAYEENENGKIEPTEGRKLSRIIYRWNGQFYTRGR